MKHFLLVLILAAVPAFSQQPSVSQQILVTASALPEDIETTPAAATVITRAEIERREARDVADVLREVPGLAVSRTGSPGKTTSLFIRGGSSKQALVLWNGVEMNNPYFSGYNFGQLSIAGVERVEIVRGPFSALYGSEAVSGVVNVLTVPRASGATIDVEGGENGLFNAALAGAIVSERWNAHGAVERRQDDGFAPNDDFASSSFSGGAMYSMSDRSSVGVLARHSTYDLGTPTNVNATFTELVPSPHRREEGSETQVAVPLRYATGRAAFELRLSDSRRDDTFSDPEGPFGPERSEIDSSLRGVRATARTTTGFGTITVGGEYEKALVDASLGFGTIDSRRRTNQSFFIEDRWSGRISPESTFELAVGLRHDDFDEFGSEFSPRVAAAWVRQGHKLRAAYGEGFRAPAIGELYFPFGGNLDLGSERSTNIEIGYERYLRRGSLSVTLFHSDYDGLITFGPSGMFENVLAATSRGIELGAMHHFGAWDLAGTYTWLDAEDDTTGERLLRRPEHSGSLSVGYSLAAWSTQLVVLYKGMRDDITDLVPFNTVINDGHTTADLTVHYRLGALAPYVKIENLTDERYEEVFGYPSPGRRAIVGIRYEVK